MELNSEVTAILTSVVLVLIIVISVLLYLRFKAKRVADSINDETSNKG